MPSGKLAKTRRVAILLSNKMQVIEIIYAPSLHLKAGIAGENVGRGKIGQGGDGEVSNYDFDSSFSGNFHYHNKKVNPLTKTPCSPLPLFPTAASAMATPHSDDVHCRPFRQKINKIPNQMLP